MTVLHRLAAFAVAAAVLAPLAAKALDANSDTYNTAAFSGMPTFIHLCDGDAAIPSGNACKDGSYAQQAKALESALRDALEKAPANVRPLLKRDQYWFGETLQNAAGNANLESKNPADREPFERMLSQRIVTLAQMTNGFPRAGVLGKWENAFGSVTVAAADDGAYRLAIITDSGFGPENTPDEHRHWHCEATALVKPANDGWLTGTFLLDEPKSTEAGGKRQPFAIKIRRQGATLRVVTGLHDWEHESTPPSCEDVEQITASYFASGKTETTADKVDTSFVAPTFDCMHPSTASDEEICADPDLADNDQRLNRAWKALLPRLDETTRRALTEDQRQWVREQVGLFADSLHPSQDKLRYQLHHTLGARDDLNKLQRERIALLEGFDENRKGLAGLWLSYTAVLKVEATDDGGIEANGWKWEPQDYKGGCDYVISGKVVGGTFRSDDKRKNPDTLERDHATLIVNRLDDTFARKRFDADDPDEQKCKRSPGRSSTVRLFPVRPSPDIDEKGDWH